MSTSAGWYPDPRGEHEHRWWDGARWTEHVATAERSSRAPVTPPGPSGGPASSAAGPPPVGASPPPPPARPPDRPARTNGKAVASLVVALVAGWVPFLGSLAAVVLGITARRELAGSRGDERGEGLAVAGIVIGTLGVLGWLLLFAVAGLALFVGTGPALDELERQLELEHRLDPELRGPRALGSAALGWAWAVSGRW